MHIQDTICALSTPPGIGALGLVRLSGDKALAIAGKIFSAKIDPTDSHRAHYGKIEKGEEVIDEVILTYFKNPHSFTGEDTVEISCHGSTFIIQQIMEMLVDKGARLAKPGEFTLRAFMNGKMDLSQAEAVADLIASKSKVSHALAMDQMKGGFSKRIKELRDELIKFASLIELELDFAEEDVEFADRDQFNQLIDRILKLVTELRDSFSYGNAIKNGVPVAIIGAPNVGKSTLLNALLEEDRAIVSSIPGTTRDTIEDEMIIDGVNYRFIDTAGIRATKDKIEGLGIARTWEKAKTAAIVLYLFEAKNIEMDEWEKLKNESSKVNASLIPVINKMDLVDVLPKINLNGHEPIYITAKTGEHLDTLKNALVRAVEEQKPDQDVVVTNLRHYEALKNANTALSEVKKGLQNNLSGDLLATDIRRALHYLGEIIGEVSTDDLLGNIFANFCIGK